MSTNIAKPVRRLLDRAQKRFARSRSGSVLILVVALLVLMALIGTAFMTMAQFDRASAVQHSFNTEVDLLLDGVVNQVKGTITSDVYSSGMFRPSVILTSNSLTPNRPVPYNTPQMPSAPRYWNGLGLDNGAASALVAAGTNLQAGDWWLASRVPGLPAETAAADAALNPPWWPFVSGPITGASNFDQPYWPNGVAPPPLTARTQVFPTSISINGQIWPAFYTATITSGALTINGSWMAADADGDGIADSGLVKLLTLDGVTYYGAVRIVDNAAAVNANIADVPNAATTYSAGSTLPGDLSPVNIDLEGMINPDAAGGGALSDLYGTSASNAQGLIAKYRWNNQKPGQGAYDDFNPAQRQDFQFPLDSNPTNPNGFNGGNYYFNEQWLQLGRRLANPGYMASGIKFQSLPISEDQNLARGFIIRNSSVANSTLSSSVLEQRMPNTLFNTAPYKPYVPGDELNWYKGSFNYYYELANGNTMSKRPLIVGQNPVSNFSPDRFNLTPPTALPPTSYQFGDVQTYKGSKYVCICPNPTSPNPLPLDPNWSDPNWAWEPWTNAPTKTSVNTATFQQLYAAYWAVMADQYTPPPTPSTTGYWSPAFPNPTDATDARMFRNPIRGTGTSGATPPGDPQLGPQQVMDLRAAIAAVNTMALRHADKAMINSYGTNDVISRTVYLPAQQTGGVAMQAQVYGVERQPYITQVFAENNSTPANSWMAIELYNPYPDHAIKMPNWVLAALDRTTPSNMMLTSISTLQAVGVTSIQPFQRIIFVSNATVPPYVTQFATPGALVSIVPLDLSKVWGKELILMRPRRADGNLSPTSPLPTTSNNFYQAESTSAPIDMVPIDSYDFTNIKQTAVGTAQEWWYVRPSGLPPLETNAVVNKDWHFVYPGPWMLPPPTGTPAPTTAPPTWSGTYATNANPTENLSAFGTPQATPEQGSNSNATTNYHDTVIQMNNVDFGGPNQPSSVSPNNGQLPLGAFPRNGDILQVTFIGSYKLSPIATPGTIYEINPVTADSAMATACDSLADTQQPIVSVNGTGPTILPENVGRFCPIDNSDIQAATGAPAAVAKVDDFAAPPTGTTSSTTWRYHWAMRIFDFLTVQAPHDDYLPDVDPWMNDPASAASPPHAYRYPPADVFPAYIPAPVANITAGAINAGLTPPGQIPTGASEDTVPVNGLINVNTAPWRVLATIPWVPASTTLSTPSAYRNYNAYIGIGLALYRDGNPLTGTPPHGPFRNLFELGEATIIHVPGSPITASPPPKLRDVLFATTPPPTFANGTTPPAYRYHFGLAQGNLTPIDGSNYGGNVPGDFQAIFNTITRISNLVTTRSDSYTAYVLIQGWRNAETPNPQLVVQRRAAVIIDRSSVTPNNRTPNATNVPQ